MALAIDDFLFPHGDLRADMLPGDDLTGAVAVWLIEAEAKAEGEDARRAWVYHRAYTAVYRRLETIAGSSSVSEKGSLSYSREQIDSFRRLADEKLAEHLALAGGAEAAPLPVRSSVVSRSTRWV